MKHIPYFDERDRRDLDSARSIFSRYGITEVYLFGAMAKGTYDEHSDWDFAYHRAVPALAFRIERGTPQGIQELSTCLQNNVRFEGPAKPC